jgi:hypothetical protein
VNMNRETVRLIPTEELGMKKKIVSRWCPGITQSNSWFHGRAQFLTFKCITVILQPP